MGRQDALGGMPNFKGIHGLPFGQPLGPIIQHKAPKRPAFNPIQPTLWVGKTTLIAASAEHSLTEVWGGASDLIPFSPTKEPLQASKLTASRSGSSKKLLT